MEKSPQSNPDLPEKKKSPFGSFMVASVGIISAIYVLNPTAGFFEIIPDNIPIFGNLDEAAAVALIISCLSYFGIDMGAFFGRSSKPEPRQAKGEVVD